MACTNHPEVASGLLACARCEQPFCPDCRVSFHGGEYCGLCKIEEVRDLQSGVLRGVLDLATAGQRFGAYWLDSSLVGIVVFLPVIILFAGIGSLAGASQRGQSAFGLIYWVALLLVVVVLIVYEGLMLSARGQTLGKMAVGIKVVTPDGGDLRPGQAWGRAVVRQVFFSYCAALNYLPLLFTKERTALHDLVCKTRVVRVRR